MDALWRFVDDISLAESMSGTGTPTPSSCMCEL